MNTVFDINMIWPVFTIHVNIWLGLAAAVAVVLWRIVHAKWVHGHRSGGK